MQTKHLAIKKNRGHIQIEASFTKDYFLWWKDFEQKNLTIYVNSVNWNCIQYILSLFLKVLLFLSTRDIQVIFLKQFLYILQRTFGEKLT